MSISPHVAFGSARTAVDNLENAVAVAVSNAQTVVAKISAIPGVSLDPDVKARLDAFREAAGALGGLRDYLDGSVRTDFKAVA